MLNTHTVARLSGSGQAGTWSTHTHHKHSPALHRPSNTIQHPSIPKNLVIRLLCSTVHATVACSLTRIRNQRPAGVVRHWKRTIVHTCLPPVRLRLLPVLVRTLITATAARVSSISTLRKLATDRHEASTFPVAGRSHQDQQDRRSASAQLWTSPLVLSSACSRSL